MNPIFSKTSEIFFISIVAFILVLSCKKDEKTSDAQINNDTLDEQGMDQTQSLDQTENKDIAADVNEINEMEIQQSDTYETYMKCEEINTGIKKIGEECSDHCECETGWCYDEGYMSPFRFCTRPCLGMIGCGEGYVCLLFSPIHWNQYGVKEHTICMPICKTLADCKKISDKYEYCPNSQTKWVDMTLAVKPTCQTKKLDE